MKEDEVALQLTEQQVSCSYTAYNHKRRRALKSNARGPKLAFLLYRKLTCVSKGRINGRQCKADYLGPQPHARSANESTSPEHLCVCCKLPSVAERNQQY